MRTAFLIVTLTLLIVSSVAFSSDSQASPQSWHAVATANANYLQQTGASLFHTGFGGPQRMALPSSVMNHTDPICSTESTDTPASCSVDPGPDKKCSAHCDFSQRCSAIHATPPGPASCSVNGRSGGRCSVLQPGGGSVTGPSNCSAFAGTASTLIQCSVMAPALKQGCSAQNPAFIQNQNKCSAHTSGSNDACSVLNGGTVFKNFCSTAFAGIPSSKICSSLAPGTNCSVNAGQKAICTNLFGAAVGSCSAHAGGSFCSVIGGSPGTTCDQP